jgi:hypothetical protein
MKWQFNQPMFVFLTRFSNDGDTEFQIKKNGSAYERRDPYNLYVNEGIRSTYSKP